MSDDYELIGDIKEEYGITTKQLARAIGRCHQSVSRYCNGDATPPSILWRTLYRLTKDARLIKLITGDVTVVVAEVMADLGKLDTVSLDHLLAIRQTQIDAESEAVRMLEDGVVNDDDRKAIEQYRKVFPEMIERQYQFFYAINEAYRKSQRTQRGQR